MSGFIRFETCTSLQVTLARTMFPLIAMTQAPRTVLAVTCLTGK